MSNLTKEQEQVVFHDGKNILVSASAGSGKTHTMIERIKWLIIEKGVSINQILAVTFTESAAADMKAKLKKALTDLINKNSDGLDKGKIDRCKEQIQEVATADICTMHAFCARIIRTYFFEVGLSPDFTVLDQAQSTVLKINALEKTFKELYELKEQWFLDLTKRHSPNRTDTNLQELVLSAYGFCESEVDQKLFLEKYEKVYAKDNFNNLLLELKQGLDQELSILIEQCEDALIGLESEGLIKGVNFTKTLIGDLKALIESSDIYTVKKLENYSLPLTFERNLSEIAKENKNIVSSARDKFKKLIIKFSKCLGENSEQDLFYLEGLKDHARSFNKIIELFSKKYDKEKREENALDFSDLEHFAIKILNNQEIREEINKKYKYVFVDEYQDTNGVQEEILNKIANENLFMVGDVKQSIYGFRGCRSKFFIDKEMLMLNNGEKVVRLNHNFRSAKKVINFVNQVFDFCMTEKIYGESYKDKARLIAGKDSQNQFEGRAELHFILRDKKDKKIQEEKRVYDVLKELPVDDDDVDVTASQVAEIILNERGNKFYSAEKGALVPVDFGDVVILTRNRNSKYVNDLVLGLIKNGIPVSSDVEENVCDYPEIKVLINALKLIDCFKQDLPLAVTLKSPIGNLTEEDLLSIVRFYEDNEKESYGGFCSAYSYYIENANTALKEKLVKFNDYFNELRFISDFIGAKGVLNRLISDCDLVARLLPKPTGEEMVDRLNRFVSASVVGEKILTVREFLLRINACPDAFKISPFAKENTVKVTTIHSSKGLEYPVVIVCGLERDFNSEDDYKEIMFSRNYGLATLRYDDANRIKQETILRGVIREENKLERIKEEMRLFYVALTRATYSLHAVFLSNEDNRKEKFNLGSNFLSFIPRSIPASVHDNTSIILNAKKAPIRDVIITKPNDEIVSKMKRNFSYEYPFDKDCYLPLKSAVTTLAKSQYEEETVSVYKLFDDSNSAESGTIAHKILEHYDFHSGISLFEQVKLLIDKNVLTEEDGKKVNLERLSFALKNPVFNDLNGKKLYREKTFLVNVLASDIFNVKSDEKVLIQGIIDLLVIDGDSANIIDYKYSVLDNNSLAKKYKKQLELYAYATEKILNKKVDKKIIVNIYSGEVVEL